ncbi:hypothetical protein BSPWISOXPB_3295 [uncultured Gammaproteobacteria bacterium]|nr:hypothetical protein BSPWISOXPB_3295 [uncultured Gammaproteobacteria bacterium]
MVIVGFIVINQFVVWFLRVDYLCKGLSLTKFLGRFKKNHIKICGSFVYKAETKKSEQLKNQLL